jgi:hypothetical protein
MRANPKQSRSSTGKRKVQCFWLIQQNKSIYTNVLALNRILRRPMNAGIPRRRHQTLFLGRNSQKRSCLLAVFRREDDYMWTPEIFQRLLKFGHIRGRGSRIELIETHVQICIVDEKIEGTFEESIDPRRTLEKWEQDADAYR